MFFSLPQVVSLYKCALQYSAGGGGVHSAALQCSLFSSFLSGTSPGKSHHCGLPESLALSSELRECARLRLSSPYLCWGLAQVVIIKKLFTYLQVVNWDNPRLLHLFPISQGSHLWFFMVYILHLFRQVRSGHLGPMDCVHDLKTKQNLHHKKSKRGKLIMQDGECWKHVFE